MYLERVKNEMSHAQNKCEANDGAAGHIQNALGNSAR